MQSGDRYTPSGDEAGEGKTSVARVCLEQLAGVSTGAVQTDGVVSAERPEPNSYQFIPMFKRFCYLTYSMDCAIYPLVSCRLRDFTIPFRTI